MTDGLDGAGASLSVVIPAHDEQAVIGRCLDRLTEGMSPGEFEIWVVANGCSDETVASASRAGVGVLEVPEAGKTGALEAGDRHAVSWPRIYLDADIEVTASAIRAVAAVLREGAAHIAAPRPIFDLSGCSRAVRAFYRTWQRLPWLTADPVGNGVFGLSEAGRSRFGDWPQVIADDLFAVELFADSERRCVTASTFLIRPPRRMGPLLAVRRRVVLGNDQLTQRRLEGAVPESRRTPHGASGASGASGALVSLLREGDRGAVLCYAFVVITARVLAHRARRSGRITWDRDDSSRGE